MEQALAILEGKIAEAAARIAAPYFQLPIADADSVYRERVYCYELYHQLRCAWEDFPFTLGGEVDKGGHPHFRNDVYAQAKPDFLVHEPGNMDRNLACVEVKPCSRGFGEFRGDLKKLTWFCRHASYHAGIFLVYGSGARETPDYASLRATLHRAADADGDIDIARIRIMVHPAVGRRRRD